MTYTLRTFMSAVEQLAGIYHLRVIVSSVPWGICNDQLLYDFSFDGQGLPQSKTLLSINSGINDSVYDLLKTTDKCIQNYLRANDCTFRAQFYKKEAEELLMKNFTKKDLKNGDFVVLRNGKIGVVTVDTENITLNDDSFTSLNNYKNDLETNTGFDGFDIVKVYRGYYSYGQVAYEINGRPIYDREKIKTVEEMTIEQVCKALGKNIKIVKG